MNISTISLASPVAPKTGGTPPSQTPSTPVEMRHPMLEDLVNFSGLAGTTAAVSAATSALMPAGVGVGHALGVLGAGGLAVVAGGLVGGMAGEAVSRFAARVSNVGHSQDEYIGNMMAGMVLGGAGGAGAALASGFLGASPAVTALVAGAGVVALGVAIALKDAHNRT